MNILIATYNYFPYNWGGSEVYVSGLVKFLQNKNHDIRIIAAVPEEAFSSYGIYWSGKAIKICKYTFDDAIIFGVKHEVSTSDIYRKHKKEWQSDWLSFFQYLEEKERWIPSFMHLHGFTAGIGISLLQAFRSYYIGSLLFGTYHTPISCPNGTLVRWKKEECTIKSNVNDCSACSWNLKTNWSPTSSKLIVKLLSEREINSQLPTFLKWRYFTSNAILAFQELKGLVDYWWVFSEQIQNTLLTEGVEKKKIQVGRHGVSKVFFENEKDLRQQSPTIFAFVGRFTSVKGLKTLFQAWLDLPDANSVRQLWLIGNHHESDTLLADYILLLEKRGDVVFLEKQDQASLAGIYRKIHCLIIPSEWVEIGPLVFHEAIASGANVIASSVGGTRELSIYYGQNCQIFSARDPESLKECILDFEYKEERIYVEPENVHYSKILDWYKSNISWVEASKS
jgi:glycosyltransferase involved in cell wall biosynthesis